MHKVWTGRMGIFSALMIILAALTASAGHCRGQAINANGTVLVPLRAVFDSLGATTAYSNGTITASKGQTSVSLKIGSKNASRNAQTIQLPVAPRLLGSQTFVPLRFVGEAFNAQVNYDKQNTLVSVIGGKVPVELYVVSPAEALACDTYSTAEMARYRNEEGALARRPIVPIALHRYRAVAGSDTADSWFTIRAADTLENEQLEREPRFQQLLARSGGKPGAIWTTYTVTNTGSGSLKLVFNECTRHTTVGTRGGLENPAIDFMHEMVENELEAAYHQPVSGTMRDLGTLGGSQLSQGDRSVAIGINNAGQVVGESRNAAGDTHAFLWNPQTGQMRDLGTLGGSQLPQGDFSTAKGINNAGQIVGYSSIAAGDTHAFLWDPETKRMRDLGTLGRSSQACDINNAGQVIGSRPNRQAEAGFRTEQGSAGDTHAFVWNPETDTMRDLGTLGGRESNACDINNAGQIVGYSSIAAGDTHAFLWDPETELMRDLGTLGGKDSFAYGINSAGQVVGYADLPSGASHAFMWDPATGKMRDLGSFGAGWSTANAINDAGQVVGESRTGSGDTHACLWDLKTGEMRDLGTLGGDFSSAQGINNAGQVIGSSATAAGYERAFLWTP